MNGEFNRKIVIVRDFFSKVRALFMIFKKALGLQLYWRWLQRRCFSVNIAKSLRTRFLHNNSGWLFLEVESEDISWRWLTYSLQEKYRNSYFQKHLSWLLPISRKRDFDVQNVLSRELCAVPLDLFYLSGAVRHTAKSNLLRMRN